MGSYLNPGSAPFRNSLRSKIYVDKSELIARTNELICTEQRYVCVSCPRRFGKSMAANMLASYYEKEENSDDLFGGLRISRSITYRDHLNQYNVIKINMQEFLSVTDSVDSMTNPREMAEFFGFTEDEVKMLCAWYKRSFEETLAG